MKKSLSRLSVAILSLSGAGLVAITDFEGFSSQAYIPVKGDVPTIGFGSTQGVKMGDKITVQEALKKLDADTKVAQNAIKRCVNVPLSQDEFDAYTSFAFNVGSSNFCNSTLVKKLNAKDYEGACRELGKWIYVNRTPVKGLKIRRESEMRRCLGDFE